METVLALPPDAPHLDACVAVIGSSRDSSISYWLVQLLGSTTEPDTRERCLSMIAGMQGGGIVQDLVLGLEEPFDERHGIDALAALTACTDVTHAPELQQAHAHVPDLSALLSGAIAGCGDSRSCDYLLAAATTRDGDPSMHELSAISAVRSIYGQEALIRAVQDSALPDDVRTAAASALAEQSGNRVRTVLANAAAAETSHTVRDALTDAAVDAPSRTDGQPAEGQNISGREELWY